MLRDRNKNVDIMIHVFFILFSLSFLIPFLFVISISFSSEDSIRNFGYALIPKEFSLTAYRFVFKNPGQIFDSYKVTTFSAIVGTFLTVMFDTLCAYPLSRRNYIFRKPLISIIFFTMLFGDGLVPSYILNTQYYGLGDKIWIYIIPGVGAWSIIIFRTFFQGLPESLAESAKIDGASELKIYFKIILPLSKPVLATMSLFMLVDRWNDWFTSLVYIRNQKLYTLQYLLQRIMMEIEFLEAMVNEMPQNVNMEELHSIPTESMRYAMLIVVAGPMVVVFPFFQKYFARGLVIGSVKG